MSLYGKISRVLFPITAIAFLGTGAWAYQEYQEKNSVLIKAENQYQRAFHELNNHVNSLHNEIGKTLALNSKKQMSTSLTNVWRLTYAAQNDLGQLPLSLMPFHETNKFLGRTGAFAYNVGVRDLNKDPLTEKEYQTLNTLYNQSGEIKQNLSQVQSQVINKNLRWMDVELALSTEDKKLDHTIIDGFKAVNRMVEHYPEMDFGPTVNNMEVRQKEKFKALKGRNISAKEAEHKLAKILHRGSTQGMKTVLSDKGDYQAYSIQYTGKSGKMVHADLTRTEGHLTWMLYDRPVKKRVLSYDQALQRAKRFLDDMGYKHMTPTSYDEAGNVMAFSMVHKEGNVFVYPETLVIKVALDNGEIVGLQADEYVFNRKPYVNEKPKLTIDQARKLVNPHLKVNKYNLAYIYGDSGKEVLCYEFLGKLGKDQYRVFINANSGDEELAEKVEKADYTI